MEQPKITTLIVTYNSADVISDLLADLRMFCPLSPVIVIDNASSDQTVEIVRQQYPETRLVQNDQNLGYSRAVNLGFAICDTPYVFLLNPDIRVPTSEVITEMVNWLDSSPQTGATGPIQYKIENQGYQLNFTCSYWSLKAFWGYTYFHIHHKWPSPQAIRVPLLNTGCILVRHTAYKQIGGINPNYFLYGEDPDLGMKLKRYGYECWLLTNVFVIHYREKSLHTLTAKQRMRTRWQAAWNISDAFLSGWGRILIDKITFKKLKRY